MRFINPKTDYAFKKIFGSTESKDILISFLNALVYEGNSTIEDLWIYFIKYARSLTSIPENMDDISELHRAFEIANQAGLTPSELEELERREMFIYDQQGAINLGREEGREQGLEEGREEEKRGIARNLLARLNDEAIAEVTGLSLKAIEELRQEVSND